MGTDKENLHLGFGSGKSSSSNLKVEILRSSPQKTCSSKKTDYLVLYHDISPDFISLLS